LNILHVVAGNLNLGAARGALWLHKGMLQNGQNSFLLTNSILSEDYENVTSISNTKKEKILNFIKNKIDKSLKNFYFKSKKGIFSSGWIGSDITKLEVYKKCDIINFHWINNGFININLFRKIDKPIVWTIRDMWPFTGGCHYAMECDNFITNCGNCIFLNSKNNLDASRIIHNRKKKFYRNDISIVAISNWLAEQAKKSDLLKENKIRMIANNIDTNIFFPFDKSISRNKLEINTEKKIILFGAINMNNEWKGFNKLLKAFDHIDRKKYYLCTFGKGETKQISNLGFEVFNFGFINNDSTMRLIYSMADVFVAPSLLEAFGKTIVEAMSCGTPVVCFDATGPKDLVDHKVNGYKAVPFSSKDIANGINWICFHKNYNQIKENAISKAVNNYDNVNIALSYIELYKEILNKNKYE